MSDKPTELTFLVTTGEVTILPASSLSRRYLITDPSISDLAVALSELEPHPVTFDSPPCIGHSVPLSKRCKRRGGRRGQ
ncbi:hypothetical protein QYE80_27400 [Pseudomonas tohonis]|nr:hypothetical protein L682_11155 [Pseudomonas alcaligenes OT 69]MDN4148731.1 hypothetical protein [Pseudomonas tohonis]